VAHGDGADAGERDLGARLGGTHNALEPAPPGALGRGERAGNRPQPAVERELADRRVAGEPSRGQLRRGPEDGKGDRQVEAGPLLAQVGRREVDGDPPERPLELR